jgi:GTP-binding protein EngB required for normal cell division
MERPTLVAENASRSLQALGETLALAIRALQASVGEDSAAVRRLVSLQDRLRDNRLQLAVLGQFKRGKSTFINALLGAPLLPVAVVPLTAVPVFISWGQSPYVRVRFRDGRPAEEILAHEPETIRDFLFRFVAEEANPQNRLAVSRVDLRFPAPILADGSLLIDTPGVGSTFRHNTEAALDVLPQCDAALFVVSADPPITATELDFLQQVKPKAARIFYVLNKIDYLDVGEQQRVAGFLREVLEQNGLWAPESRIFPVSARSALVAKQAGDRDALAASGMAEVEAHLVRQLATEKTGLFQAAMSGNVASGLAQAMAEVSLRIEALKLPVDELAAKAKVFAESLHAIEERQRVTRDVLAGEQRNLREEVERRVAALRKDASSELALLAHGHAGQGEAIYRAMERIFDAARAAMVEEFSRRTDAALASHQKRVDADVEAVRRAAAEIFHTSFHEVDGAEGFSLRHEPYWVTPETGASLVPDPRRWLERLFPKNLRASRQRDRMWRQIDELIIRNAENLRWALLRGIDETFREAAASFQAQLDNAARSTRGVIEETLTRRRDTSGATAAELDRLERAGDLLSVLHRQTTTGAHRSVRRLDLPAETNSICPG